MRTRTWIMRHWRGDLPLAESVWAAGTLAFVVLSAVVEADRSEVVGLLNMYGGFIYEVGAHGALTAVLVWWGIGTWRSATRHSRIGWRWGARFAKVAAVLLMVVAAYESAFAGVLVTDVLMYLAGDPYETDNGVRVIGDGTELEVYGTITRTVSAAFGKALLDSPRPIVRIRFDSPGGRSGAAFEIERMIAARGLDTLVEWECSSGCVYAFLGGRHRWATPTAWMGFHRGHMLVGTARGANDQIRQFMAQAGVASSFLDKVYAGPESSGWYPSVDDLLAAGVITGIVPDDGLGRKVSTYGGPAGTGTNVR